MKAERTIALRLVPPKRIELEDSRGAATDRTRWLAISLAARKSSPIQTSDEDGRLTIAGKPSDDVHPKTLADIFKQAKIEKPKGG